jgi:hypothetical protein
MFAWIALPGADFSRARELVVADRSGSNPRMVWQGQLATVAFSPDGAQLAVGGASGVSTDTTNLAVWVLGTDGSNPHQIASGYAPVWRPGAGGSIASVPAVIPPPSAAPTVADQRQLETCQATDREETSEFHYTCHDGAGYVFDFGAATVSLYDPASPDSGMTDGPWQLTRSQSGTWDWLDPVRGRACQLALGNHLSNVSCTGGGPATETVAPSEAPAPAAPDTLTDSMRSDILMAVHRANDAWSRASATLDASVLKVGVAGQELSNERSTAATHTARHV